MAWSNPSLNTVDIPDEVPPNNRFTVTVNVHQDGPDPWMSEDSCITNKLDIKGWKTPVALFVDGEKVDSDELCLASGNDRSTTLTASLSETGQHSVKVVVYSVGGNAYDLGTTPHEPNDDIVQTIEVVEDARDPSRPGAGESVMQWFEKLADAIGGRTQTLAAGMVLAVVLLIAL